MDKIKKYTTKQLENAIGAIKGGILQRKTSITFGIPRITLNDRVSGKLLEHLNIPPIFIQLVFLAKEVSYSTFVKYFMGIIPLLS